jgi:hypothetical protein
MAIITSDRFLFLPALALVLLIFTREKAVLKFLSRFVFRYYLFIRVRLSRDDSAFPC